MKKEELYVTDDEARAIIGNRKIVAFDPGKSDIIYGVMKKKERKIHFLQIQSLVISRDSNSHNNNREEEKQEVESSARSQTEQ